MLNWHSVQMYHKQTLQRPLSCLGQVLNWHSLQMYHKLTWQRPFTLSRSSVKLAFSADVQTLQLDLYLVSSEGSYSPHVPVLTCIHVHVHVEPVCQTEITWSSEQFKTPKTDCLLKFYQDQGFYQLGFQVCWPCWVACHLKWPAKTN